MSARAERGQIAARVDQSAAAAMRPQGLDRAIDGEALGDAAEIDAKRRAHAGERGLDEIKIRQPSRGARQARIEASVRGTVKPPAQLEHLKSPGVERYAAAGLAARETQEIAIRTGRMHQPFDGCDGLEGRAQCAVGGSVVGALRASTATNVPKAMRSLDAMWGGEGLDIMSRCQRPESK